MITDKQVEQWFDSFGKLIAPILGEMELGAIWLNKKVATSSGPTLRITEGMNVRVINNELQESGELTHRVLGCFGCLDSTGLNLMTLNLETLELNKINL